MGKNPFSSLWRTSRGSRLNNLCKLSANQGPVPEPGENSVRGGAAMEMVAAVPSKVKKMMARVRLWMRFNKSRETEVLECDKSAILKRVVILSRVLRILSPVLCHSSNILAREKAMVFNDLGASEGLEGEAFSLPCSTWSLALLLKSFLNGIATWKKETVKMKAVGKPVESTSPNDGEISLHEHSTNGVQVEITKFKSKIRRIFHVVI